jgi:hypothetical protein
VPAAAPALETKPVEAPAPALAKKKKSSSPSSKDKKKKGASAPAPAADGPVAKKPRTADAPTSAVEALGPSDDAAAVDTAIRLLTILLPFLDPNYSVTARRFITTGLVRSGRGDQSGVISDPSKETGNLPTGTPRPSCKQALRGFGFLPRCSCLRGRARKGGTTPRSWARECVGQEGEHAELPQRHDGRGQRGGGVLAKCLSPVTRRSSMYRTTRRRGPWGGRGR